MNTPSDTFRAPASSPTGGILISVPAPAATDPAPVLTGPCVHQGDTGAGDNLEADEKASIELKVRGYARWLESEQKRLAREAWIDAKMREEGK